MKSSKKVKPGSIDTSFRDASDSVSHISVIIPLPDNKILIADKKFYDSVYCLHPDGSVKKFFKTDTLSRFSYREFYSFLSLPDGKILFGSLAEEKSKNEAGGLYRCHPDGSIDESLNMVEVSFNNDCDDYAAYYALAALPDGRILAGGDIKFYGRRPVSNIICLHPDGKTDEYFTTEGEFNDIVTALAVLPDGRILAGGNFTDYFRDLKNSKTTYNGIICFEYDGMVDESFTIKRGFKGAEDIDYDYDEDDPLVKAFAVQPDGKILAVGGFVGYDYKSANYIVRLHPNGKLDTSFNIGTGFDNHTSNVTVLPDGRILVLGIFTEYNGVPCKHIACLHPDGSLDDSFNVGNRFNGSILSFAILPNNRILLGGDFTEYDGIGCNRIACLYI